MPKKHIEHAADKSRFLTLDQVAAFVQDAMRAGAGGGEIVTVSMSFTGKLQKISVAVETVGTEPSDEEIEDRRY